MNFLKGKEQVQFYLVFALILALSLHLWIGQLLIRQAAPIFPPKPVVMEVTMLAPPVPVVKELPPPVPPVKTKPPPPKKQAVKPAVKPPVKAKKIVVPKQETPKPASPKLLTRPKTPDAIKEAFTVPSLPDKAPEFSKPSPVVTPIAAKSTATVSNPGKVASNSVGSGNSDSKTASSGVVVLVQVKPKYPMRALNRHIEGWVKIEFTVSTAGSVNDAHVVAAEPEGVFDEAALSAISKWKFKAKVVNGKSVEQQAVQTLKFKLSNQ